MPSDTRDRILTASSELLRRQGYTATGVKQIVSAAQAPFGSLYHFFPGGKEELGEEVIRTSGALYGLLIDAVIDPAPDPISGVRDFFELAAVHLRDSDYADACPIATVALEVSSTSEPMRVACADVFSGWIDAATERFVAAGCTPERGRELSIAMIAILEGAFVLSRALRSTEPLRVAGATMVAYVAAALDAGEEQPGR